jgi:hypothetical protein
MKVKRLCCKQVVKTKLFYTSKDVTRLPRTVQEDGYRTKYSTYLRSQREWGYLEHRKGNIEKENIGCDADSQ